MVDVVMDPPLPQAAPGLQKRQSQFNETIKISVEDIVGQFAECIICFQTFNDPYITKCGHTFCKECIHEVVNRQHKCPICNKDQNAEDLIRNYNFGELLNNLQKERDNEKQKWIDRLVNQGAQPGPGANPQGQAPKEEKVNLGPIQTVFSLNLKESLLAYQEFYDKIHKEKVELRQKVKSKFSARLMELQGDQPQEVAGREAINNQLELQLNQIESKFDKSVEFLQCSYDDYMKKAAPVPQFLPIRVNINWQWKFNKNLENIHINPMDSAVQLLKQLGTAYENRGDPVLNWNMDQLQLKIIGPLAGYDGEVEENKEAGIMSQERIIDDMNAPFASYRVAQGSVIMIAGSVMFNSDKPSECMTLKFRKEEGKTFTYYSCKTCNSNWICESCKKACHDKNGHETLLHVMDHKASAPVCYCVKKKLCKIPNFKNPQNGLQ